MKKEQWPLNVAQASSPASSMFDVRCSMFDVSLSLRPCRQIKSNQGGSMTPRSPSRPRPQKPLQFWDYLGLRGHFFQRSPAKATKHGHVAPLPPTFGREESTRSPISPVFSGFLWFFAIIFSAPVPKKQSMAIRIPFTEVPKDPTFIGDSHPLFKRGCD
jgi:hypothetical protein